MITGAPHAIAGLSGTPGVYRFRDARGNVLYIGRATTLRNRVASYWSDLRERGHLAPMVARVARIEAVACNSPHEAAWLERNLLETSLPPWNRTLGGQENVVYIRMDQRPSAPGFTVEHLRRPAGNVQYFGPYLGGLRVRQALAALHRILPLSYTGTLLRGAQLDMARARGFASADRKELIGTLTAVLQRQPGALAWAPSRTGKAAQPRRRGPCLRTCRPDPHRDRCAGLGDLSPAGHHHGCRRLRRVRMVWRRASALRHPRRAALPVVPAQVQPVPCRAAASRHTG